MEAPDTSSTSTCSSLLTYPDPDEYDEHNMWNPMLGLFCHEHFCAFMEAYFGDVGLERSALSCHFALERRFIVLTLAPFGTIASSESLSIVIVTTQALL